MPAKKPADDELELLFPEGKTITAGGEEIVIAPLSIVRLAKVARILRPAQETMGDEIDVTRMLAEHGEAAIAAVAVALDKPASWAENLLPDEFLTVAMVVFEVNADFFMRRVAPQLARAVAALNNERHGPTSSSD